MDHYPIEHGVLIWDQRCRFRRDRQELPEFRLADMAVGDSFAVPADDARRARNAASRYSGLHYPVEFESRTLPDGGLRIWRIR